MLNIGFSFKKIINTIQYVAFLHWHHIVMDNTLSMKDHNTGTITSTNNGTSIGCTCTEVGTFIGTARSQTHDKKHTCLSWFCSVFFFVPCCGFSTEKYARMDVWHYHLETMENGEDLQGGGGGLNYSNKNAVYLMFLRYNDGTVEMLKLGNSYMHESLMHGLLHVVWASRVIAIGI